MFNEFPPPPLPRKSFRLRDNVRKYGRGRPAIYVNIIWRMRFAFCISKATNTHSEYIRSTSFPQQQQLHERSSILRYMYVYIATLVYVNNTGRELLMILAHSALLSEDIRNIHSYFVLNPLNPELNPICYLLALLAHHFLHVSSIRVKSLTIRLLM